MPTHEPVVAAAQDAALRGRDGRGRIGVDQGRVGAVTRDPLHGREAPAHVVASGRLIASSTSTTTYHLANLEGTYA